MRIVTFNWLYRNGYLLPYYDSEYICGRDNWGNPIFPMCGQDIYLSVINPSTPREHIERYDFVIDGPTVREIFPDCQIYDAEPYPEFSVAIQGTTPLPNCDEINEIFVFPRKLKILFITLYKGWIEDFDAKGEPRFSRYMFRKTFVRRFGYDPITGWPDMSLVAKVDYLPKNL